MAPPSRRHQGPGARRSQSSRDREDSSGAEVTEREQLAGAPLELFAAELAQLVAAELRPDMERLVADAGGLTSPWLTTAQAIAYSGLPEGTFRKLAACGKIPSHGGRSKIFYRPEVDQALLSSSGVRGDARRLRSVR